jgi:hypothetical protein
MMDFIRDFSNLLANDEYFRSGFISGIALLLVFWLLSQVYLMLTKQWLKIRQFFEPIKKPGKVPTETGPSPAGMLLGCIGRIVVTLVAFVFLFLLWWVLLPAR